MLLVILGMQLAQTRIDRADGVEISLAVGLRLLTSIPISYAVAQALGLDPLSPQWAEDSGADDAARRALTELVDGLLEQRQKARAERDFATADLLRDRLLASGVAVEDTPDGPLWTLKDG